MQYENNSVAQILGVKYPLIQAPMSWITDARLVAAVSNSGGLGVLGPHAGQSPEVRGQDAVLHTVREEIRKTQTLTDKPFGINLLSLSDGVEAVSAATLDIALEEGVRHFAIVGVPNQDLFQKIKARGGVVIFRPLTPTVANMREAEAFGADLLVATGYDEGGHIPQRALGTFTVVPTMADAVNIPVLAAGGINDRRGVQAAFALGAQGVYIGTRFIATQEALSADSVKQKILASGFDDLLQVSDIQRSIRTPAAERLAAKFADPHNTDDLNAEIAELGGLRPAMLEGKDGVITVNTGIDIIKTVPTVAELIAELMR